MHITHLTRAGLAVAAALGLLAAAPVSAQSAQELIDDASDPSTILT